MHSPGQAIADIKRMLAERQVLASPAATPFLSLSPFREREDRPASAGSEHFTEAENDDRFFDLPQDAAVDTRIVSRRFGRAKRSNTAG
jgi:hypothetical protein